MGAGLLPEEFEEKLVGLKKGQTAEFDLDMPANPPVLLRALKDKTEKIHFDVEVKAVRKKILPRSPMSGSRRLWALRTSRSCARAWLRA